MARYLDELKKLILDQTQKVGAPVANIYGLAAAPLSSLTGAEQSTWLVLSIAGRNYETIEAFYADYGSQEGTITRLLDTTTGTVVWQHSGLENVTTLFRGTVEVANSRVLNIAAQAGEPQASYILQVDGAVKRSGAGGAEIAVLFEPGTHTIEVLVSSNTAGVKVPKDVRVRGDFERVPQPMWHSATTGYVDDSQGQAVVTLKWMADTRAGGWRVLRRQLTTVAAITAVSAMDANRDYVVTLAGNVGADVSVGEDLRAINELMGAVRSLSFDGTNTVVRMRLGANRSAPTADWVGRNALRGAFVERVRVGRTQASGTVTWQDATVIKGQLYDYALQAWGFLDANMWSPLSNIQTLNAGDTQAPQKITFLAGYPKVVNRRAYVSFQTPSDTDYSGVRVYYRRRFTGTATSGGASSITDTGKNFTGVDATFTVEILEGTGAGQVRTATGITGTTQVNVSVAWSVNPDATSRYIVYKDTHLLTDYGLPNTEDQLTFEPASTAPDGPVQEYYFRTFDNALNEQQSEEGRLWSYNPGLDGAWTSPPIVGIRQVPTTEQVLFSAPYNNPTNYAIVELSASDVLGRRGLIELYYKRRTDALVSATTGSTSLSVTGTGYARAAGSFVTDGFAIGMSVDAVGFTNAQNNGVSVVTAVAALALTVTKVNGLVVEGAAAGRTITAETSIFLPASADPATEGGTPRVLDVVTGTRSRYVAIDRTIDQNWIRVFAYDVDGNRSDTQMYSVDYDDRPEIASFEGRLDPFLQFTTLWNTISGNAYGTGTTQVDPVRGMVMVTGAVDDDARGLKYWIEDPTGTDPTLASPLHVDMSTVRSLHVGAQIGLAFTLAEGERKVIVLEPWSGFSGGVVTGTAGEQVRREFSRTPRATVHFEDKDEFGNASGKRCKIQFEISTAAVNQVSGRTSHATSTATTLKDSVSPGWTVDQFASIGRARYYVWMHDGTNPTSAVTTPSTAPLTFEPNGQIRRIDANTADTLTVFPAWTTIPVSKQYRIIDAAVLFKLDGSENFKPTSGIAFFDRKEAPATTLVEYYATKNKCPDEGVKRTVVDADTIPSFTSMTLTNPATNTLKVLLAGPDDDVKFWRAFRRKALWPTLAGNVEPTTAAEVLRQYLHHEDQVANLTYESFADAGTHYVVVVPMNALNQDGPIQKGTFTIVGSGSPNLSNLRTTHEDGGGTINNRVKWDHANTTTHPVKVWAKRRIESTGQIDIADVELTGVGGGAATRVVNLDSESGPSTYTNTSDTDTLSNVGSWIHTTIPTARATPATGVAYTWVYRVELYDTPGTGLLGTYTIEDTDYYLPSDMTIATATASVNTFGNGTGSPATCNGVPSRRVQWTLNFANDAAFTVKIEVATDAAGTGPWTLVASGLTPSSLNWYHFETGYYKKDPGGVARYWTYRVSSVRNSDGATINTVTTSPLPTITYLTDTCTGGPN